MPATSTRRPAKGATKADPLPLHGLIAPADVYDRVRQLIVRGELPPASRVAEAELAGKLGVSRTPAREAMRPRSVTRPSPASVHPRATRVLTSVTRPPRLRRRT